MSAPTYYAKERRESKERAYLTDCVKTYLPTGYGARVKMAAMEADRTPTAWLRELIFAELDRVGAGSDRRTRRAPR